jgi:NAD(P)-dependent dehydrogenase (short-subunit alcohol dehydrogenase family)
MNNNQPKTAIVTGGAQGIGRQTVEDLLKHGYQVMIADSDGEAIDEAMTGLYRWGTVGCQQTDVSVDKDVILLINQTINQFGRIDLLINNAAISVNKPVCELTIEEWNRVIGVNLTGTFLCSKHAAPHLRKSNGSIINICSTRAFMSEKDTEAYSASKGGIYSLTHAMAMSLGPEIRVNCISPGWIEVSDLKKKSNLDPANLTVADHSQHPAGRVGKASDITSMILFLASPENSFITGQNFIIDGGMTKKMMYV